MTYINAVRGLLLDKKWYSKAIEGEMQRRERVQKMREKTMRLKGKLPTSSNNLSWSTANAYEAYESRPVGGGGFKVPITSYDDYDNRPISGSQKIIIGPTSSGPNKSMWDEPSSSKQNFGKTTYQRKKIKVLSIEEEDYTHHHQDPMSTKSRDSS